MNGRKAKLLRRKAEQQTIGGKDREYQGKYLSSNQAKSSMVSINLTPTCTRTVYQKLKKES